MKARAIPFSAPMVRALLDGRKTQTRRIVKPPSGWGARFPICNPAGMAADHSVWWWDGKHERVGVAQDCPYGVPGDLLWVREACCAEELSRPEESRPATRRERRRFGRTTVLVLHEDDGADGVRYLADDAWRKIENAAAAGEAWSALFHYGGAHPGGRRGRSVPSIHMPRWASRITLRITDVRVERLNEISEADALAEGVRRWPDGRYSEHNAPLSANELAAADPVNAYRALWERINGPGSWDANLWVWVVTFEVIP